PWKKAVVLDPGWKEDSWGDEQWATGGSANIQPSVLKKEAPIPASLNPWNVLNQESSSSSSPTTVMRSLTSGKQTESRDISTRLESSSGSANGGNLDAREDSEVVDDWEK
ncbi:NF-X1-type zinc finger protein NFXL1-like, partial [Trifolium medium]|nr:NF-X1-type zinc finger protein NFXL1-like [Trifolium medium]